MSWEEHSEKLRSLWEVFLVFTSGIFLLMSFGTPYWEVDLSQYNVTGVKKHAGLWTCCVEKGTAEECRNSGCNIPGKLSQVMLYRFYTYLYRSRDRYTGVDVFSFCLRVAGLYSCHSVIVKMETQHVDSCYKLLYQSR